jgi:tetratricopeptide (TPR) repeat protein
MQTRHYIVFGLALIASFAGGFFLANSLNRSQLSAISESQRNIDPQSRSSTTGDSQNLTDQEIDEKLAEAQKNAENFSFQKGLGLALYRYAAIKRDQKRLKDVVVLLDRAYVLNPDDYQVLVSLANVNFDLGLANKDQGKFSRARELYEAALKKNPKDPQVLGDLGATYLEIDPAQDEKAVVELSKSYEIDKRSEKVVMNLAKAYSRLEKYDQASEFVKKLKEMNPKNPEIGRIEASILVGGSK